ncbi:hypothetical protein [Fictibacillus terranigra]|uniref:DUF5659 domain-containing protein n=1 Tax=Fictibacillus terranigra TaxID=3058424 RepID=A0ABT8E6U9_9BACL|nr:hypothetical protein [Fictibacillus sp. CENA-BCM004]MDN4073633.1 hypothetical protein [Fictibacillus sp. CENA-BCM004]
MSEKFKCVLSMRVAKALVSKNYQLVDIEPSKRYPGKLVFVFRNTPELESELAKFKREA